MLNQALFDLIPYLVIIPVILKWKGYNLDMTHFFTRTGDDGFTGLLGEGRVPKYHPRTETIGTVDEASAAIGLARTAVRGEGTAALLLEVQRDLYHLMAEVAATVENADRFRKIDEQRVEWLEKRIKALEAAVELPSEFIAPGDSPAGAMLAVARTIVRRAERRVAELLHSGEIENQHLLRYLNRLSSLCFALELVENAAWGKDTPTLVKDTGQDG